MINVHAHTCCFYSMGLNYCFNINSKRNNNFESKVKVLQFEEFCSIESRYFFFIFTGSIQTDYMTDDI